MTLLHRMLAAAAALALAAGAALAQQDVQYTQFMHNKLALNPAVSGSKGAPVFHGLARKQWFGLDGGPASQAAGFQTPLRGKAVGLGFVVTNDEIGFTRSTQAAASYAYHVRVSRSTYLSGGLQASVRQYRVNWDEATATDANDPNVPQAGQSSRLMPNFGAGALLYNDKFYAGISAPRLMRNLLTVDDEYVGPEALGREDVHVYAMGGALLPLTDVLSLKSAALVKYVNRAPLDLDVHASLVYDDLLSLGLTYRVGGELTSSRGESIDLLAGIRLSERLRLGAAWDFTLTEVRRHTSGSAELFVEYTLARPQGRLTNPRFF